MKQARYKEPLPLAVIEAARAGDAGAVERERFKFCVNRKN